jgi:tetratricopeptide (TPR) repeat protein
MKYFAFVLLSLISVTAWSQGRVDATNLQLAGKYYQEKNYEKAAPLYEQIYQASQSTVYFNMYLDCLVGLGDYETAEKAIRQEIRKRPDKSAFYVQWGYILKSRNNYQEAEKKFDQALEAIGDNPNDYRNLANAFISRREFGYAEKVYLLARNRSDSPDFHYELANVYYYQRNYEKMLQEYLDWLNLNPANMVRVKNSIQSALSGDINGEVNTQMKSILIKKTQDDPGNLNYARLLIWFFTQDKNYTQALRQAIALDRRAGEEKPTIFSLGDIAASGHDYENALKAYNYLIEAGDKSEYYLPAYKNRVLMYYRQMTEEANPTRGQGTELEQKFTQALSLLGETPQTADLLLDYAHLETFYLNNPEKGLQLLEQGMKIPGLTPAQQSLLKAEIADTYVYSGDFWEAVLIYAQVIESNKNNELGDDVKLKKARLGYYMGNFTWAKAQLDILKASTSKLIANDAFELSLFIGDNLDEDTTATALQMFARADLMQFRNQTDKAMAVLDSVQTMFPYNSLTDDVYFRKATILAKQGKPEEAAEFLEKIVREFSTGMLADDAIFMLAGLYQNNLKQPKKALELYQKMLTEHPGSIYTVESRELYRKLRDDLSSQNNQAK